MDGHHMIGRNILIASTFLFSIVLISTILTLLSYNENSSNQIELSSSVLKDQNNSFDDLSNDLSNDDSNKNDLPNNPPPKIDLLEEELNIIKEDSNLKDFLDTLNSILEYETQLNNQNNLHSNRNNSTNHTSSAKKLNLNLEQNWQQKSSLKLNDAFAQRLSRLVTNGEMDDEMIKTPSHNYAKVYRDIESKNYRSPHLRVRKERIYSDEDYYDKISKEPLDNTIDVYDTPKFDYQDHGEVKYYLIRKEHNRINLATTNEVKGLNELINNAFVNQVKYSKQHHSDHSDHSDQMPSHHPHHQYMHPPSANHYPYMQSHSDDHYPYMHPNMHYPYMHAMNPHMTTSTTSTTSTTTSTTTTMSPPMNFAADQIATALGTNFQTVGGSSLRDNLLINSIVRRQIPYSQLTMKQRVKINLCERMLRKVHLYPSTMLLPVYNGN